MSNRWLRLQEKPLEGVQHGYSLSDSPSIRISNQVFGDLERAVLSPWYRKIAIDRPIFIVGHYRSGTTVLGEIVTTHPKVGYFSYVTNIYYRAPVLGYLITRLLWAFGVLDSEPIPTLQNPRLLETTLSPSECEWVWSQSKSNLWDPQVTDLTAGPDFSDPAFERYIESMIRRHLLIRHATRFENKNPVNGLRMGYLRKLFPDARFVFIVRHPVDTVLSHYRTGKHIEGVFYPSPRTRSIFEDSLHIDLLSKRIKTCGYDRTMALNQEHRLLGIAHQWAEMQQAILEAAQTCPGLAEQLLQIRYEELVSEPESTLGKVWAFVGLADADAESITAMYKPRLSAPPEKEPTAEEQEYLPRIREIVAPVARQFGYAV